MESMQDSKKCATRKWTGSEDMSDVCMKRRWRCLIVPDWLASHSHPASPVSPKCCSKAHIQPEMLWPHHWCVISLHWLYVPERITFKAATLTYRALHGSAPPYLVSSFTCVANMPHRRRLRSASTEQLDVPACRWSTFWGRAFPATGVKVWNSLPSDVTLASSLSEFKNRLKTYLYRHCYETGCEWHFSVLSISIFLFVPLNSSPYTSKNVYDDHDDDDCWPVGRISTGRLRKSLAESVEK